MRRKFLSILLTLAMSAAFLVPFGASAAEETTPAVLGEAADSIFKSHAAVSASSAANSYLPLSNMTDGDETTRYAESSANTTDLTLTFSLDGLYRLTGIKLLERVSNGGRSGANLTADVSLYTKNGWEQIITGQSLPSNGSTTVGATVNFEAIFQNPTEAAAVRVVIHKNSFSTQLEFIEAYGWGTALTENYVPGYATIKDVNNFGHNSALPLTNAIDGDFSTRALISSTQVTKTLEYEINLLAPRKLSGLSLIEYSGQYRAKATPKVTVYYETLGANPEYKEAATDTLEAFSWNNSNQYGSYIFFDESITTSKIKICFEDIARSDSTTENCALSLQEIVTWCTDIDNVFHNKTIKTNIGAVTALDAVKQSNMIDGIYGCWSVNSNRYASVSNASNDLVITVDLKDMYAIDGVTVVYRVNKSYGTVKAKAITYSGGAVEATEKKELRVAGAVNQAGSIYIWFDQAVPAQKVEITVSLQDGETTQGQYEIWEVIGHGKKASLNSVSFEAAGGTVTTLPQTGSFTVKPTYTAVSGNAVSIAALYDSEGRLLTTASAAPGNALEITVPEGKTAANLKVFTWDSMQTAAPILAAYDYAAQVQ